MRLLSILSLTALLSAPAFAADLGTYRPGTPYQSVVAPGADVCENHCAGDAQCRGWNYVKANPAAPGVCEFISTVSAPVSSSISISGLGNASPISNRVVQGGSNTVRVGTSVTPKPQSSVTRVGNRRVVREAAPQRIQPQTAATRRVVRPVNPSMAGDSLTVQQNRYRMQTGQIPRPQTAQPQPRAPLQFRPMLDGAGPYAAPQRPQGQNQQATPRPQVNQRPQAMQPQYRQPARRRGSDARPPVGQAIQPPAAMQGMQALGQGQPQRVPSQMMPRASAQAPVTQLNSPEQALKQRQAALIANSRQQAQGLTAEQAQQSLYGSLHDDVKVPAANMPMPADPNAPIPTVASRPTVPVQVEGLAGAATR